jgi:type III secretory pathway component EscS
MEGSMGIVSAAVLPVTAIVGVLVAVTRPLGSDSVMLVVAALAVAGITLMCAGWMNARSRRR